MSEHVIPAADDVTTFESDGYWIGPRVFEEATVTAAFTHARDVCDGRYELGRPPFVVYPAEGPAALRKIDNAWFADAAIAAISTSPQLGRMAAELLGVEEIYLWHDQLLWKPPGGTPKANVGFHQDRGYWTASTTSDMVTAWVALCDVTEDMGALRFVPGSNRWGKVVTGNAFFETDLEGQRRGANLPEGAEWRETVAELGAGQASFHHSKTVHGSGPNTTEHPRVGIAVHMMSGEARKAAGRYHPNQRLFDGSDGDLWRGPAFPRMWPPPEGDVLAAFDRWASGRDLTLDPSTLGG